MELVVIESPYAGNVEENLTYLRACMAHTLALGEAPFASHAIYTQPGVLDDSDPVQRRIGIDAGFVWAKLASRRAIYVDLGISGGMIEGMRHAIGLGQEVVFRTLHNDSRRLTDAFRIFEELGGKA